MSTLTLRSVKLAPLTYDEVDTNFVNLNTDKVELTDLSVTINAAGTASLAYNSATGVFAYTPPNLSSYLTDITGESIESLSDVNAMTPTDGQLLTWDAGNSRWDAASLATDIITLDNVTTVNAVTANKVTFGGLVIDGEVEEQQYNLTGTDIDPANGTIQYKTLAANTTFTESLIDGEYVTLMIDDGTGFTVTWPTITWVGGVAPTLETTGYNIIELWQVNGTLYGAYIGAA